MSTPTWLTGSVSSNTNGTKWGGSFLTAKWTSSPSKRYSTDSSKPTSQSRTIRSKIAWLRWSILSSFKLRKAMQFSKNLPFYQTASCTSTPRSTLTAIVRKLWPNWTISTIDWEFGTVSGLPFRLAAFSYWSRHLFSSVWPTQANLTIQWAGTRSSTPRTSTFSHLSSSGSSLQRQSIYTCGADGRWTILSFSRSTRTSK